ncbi:vWA domain-containing protein [Ornithinibacillus bavariensis]|uniref:VWFA domain-containing protein n=1 Tax=Ornithinibacillus bavariensis TaxID=545502 RepID=A0A919X5I0_9BACI|nr:BatA and WFA domain-containing protein [Ornithinibacillus bavariensis]GIO26286.1 hypothetical protein J43TS3_08970 [Ornithinibacillus bavariensis]
MQFIAPIYFLLSIFLVITVLFYLFRKQYENQIIPSTLLWQQVMREWQATKWWKKLQNHILLYLQLLILFLLMLSITRPFWSYLELSGEHIIVVLDSSASMTTEEGDLTRLDLAKNELLNLIDHLDNQRLSIILVEDVPKILLANETSKQKMESMISEVTSSYRHADVRKAIQVANQLLSDTTGEIHVFSDRVNKADVNDLNLSRDLIVNNLGITTKNISLHNFGVAEKDGNVHGLLTIYNEDEEEQLVRITIESEGKIIQEIQDIVEQGKLHQLSLPDLPVKPYYKAMITTVDNYEADNTAIAFLATESKPTFYLIGDINPFITKVLNYLSNDIVQMKSDQEGIDKNGIFIVEQLPEKEWPNGPLFILSPPTGGTFQVGEKKELTIRPQVVKQDPIFQFVNMDEVYIQSSASYQDEEFDTILTSGDIPLISKGNYQGNPIVFLGFDIADTDWPLHASFPIFLYNVMNYLTENQETLGYVKPLEPVEFSHSAVATESKIVTEEGKKVTSLDMNNSFFQAPRFPGLYRVLEYNGKSISEKLFAVSIDQQDKYIKPSESFSIQSKHNTNSKDQKNPNEIWPLLVFIAFLLLLLEWEVYRHGISN